MSSALQLNRQPDVLVVGGGAAGMLAAASAARKGASVVVVRKGEGATGLSSGAIDIADAWHDVVPGPAAPPLAAGASYLEGATHLARRYPHHPYARIGSGGRERMQDAMALFRELVPALGLTCHADASNHVVVSPLGTTKRSAWLPAHAAIDFSKVAPASLVCIVDFADLANFSAVRAADTLRWVAGLGGDTLKIQVVSVPMEASRLSPYENGRQMAYALDDPQLAEDLAERVRNAIASMAQAPDLIMVPAVLGIRNADAVRRRLEAATGCPVRELLALPPSAPGARLHAALESGVSSLGVQLAAGTVYRAEIQESTDAEGALSRSIGSIGVRTGRENVDFAPRAVVLASGRFWAGGLTREGTRQESIFSLPVVSCGKPVGAQFVGSLTGDRPEKEHELFRSGVAYSDALQPLAADGLCAAQNLFAAGSILSGYDPAKDGSGLGVCALTGMLAGERAAACCRTQE